MDLRTTEDMKTTVCLFAVSLLLAATFAHSADIPLAAGGDLAAAVSGAQAGDTITLETGTYPCAFLTVAKAITIRGAGPATILNAGTSKTAITLNHADALLEDVRVHSTKAEGLVNINHGTCRRVTVDGATERGIVFSVAGADAVMDSCVATNVFREWAGTGYIVKQSAGLVMNTDIIDVYGPNEAVYIDGGVFSNCTVRGMIDDTRDGSQAKNGQSFAAIKVCGTSALVTHSRFVGNGLKKSAKDGTVIISAGTVRNCLVADNVVQAFGGVNLSGGRLESCTVVGTTRYAGSSSGLSLHMTGGTAVNNVFADCESGVSSVVVTGGTLATNLLPAAVRGTGGTRVGNVVGRPLFADAASDDYAPGLGSPAVNAAAPLPWMAGAADLRGAPRVNAAAPDIGAFEGRYDAGDPLACGFSVANAVHRADAADTAVVFTATAAGDGAATATFAWYLDGADTPAGTGATFTKSDFTVGYHSVRLVATPTAGEPASYEAADCVLVYPATMYVDSSCATPAAPYATPATAATSIADAIGWLRGDGDAPPAFGFAESDAVAVLVRNGSGAYPVHALSVAVPARIAADAGCSPVLDLGSKSDGILLLHPQASLDGFILKNVRSHAVDIEGGARMANCALSGQNTVGYAPICSLDYGEVDSCAFTNITGSYAYENYVVKVGAGTLKNSLIANIGKQFDWMVRATSASSVISNCVIRNSPGKGTEGTDNLRNGVLLVENGLATHCVITNSGSLGAGKEGTVKLTGGTIRNCLFAGNKSYNYGGVYMTGGTLENCTVAHNAVNPGTAGTGRDLYQTAGTVRNCIFWNTDGVDGVTTTGGTISGTLSNAQKTGTGNTDGAPNFIDAANGDFNLADNSFARDIGVNQPWMADGTDLAGNPRIVADTVDAGCYEGAPRAERLAAVLTASMTGVSGSDCLYRVSPFVMFGADNVSEYSAVWTVDGAAAGATAGPLDLALAPRATPYSIAATISGRGETAETDAILVQVNFDTYYLDASSASPAFPYATAETAAKTLSTILTTINRDPNDLRPFTVHVAPGNYGTEGAIITAPWRFMGSAPGAVFNSGATMAISHENAAVSNIVFTGIKFTLGNGEMRDAIFRNFSGQSGASLLTITGGICDGLVVTNNKTTAWNFQTCVAVTGGTLRDFLIEDNAGYDKYLHMNGSGAVASNGTIRACTGGLKTSQNNTQHYAIRLENGLVSHCRVTGNGDLKCVRDGIVRASGGTLRNSLVAGNLSTDCAGVYLCGGTLESCTVVVREGESLHQTGKGTYGSCLNFTSGTARNCIFHSGETAESGKYYVRKTGGTLSHSWGNPGGSDPTFDGTGVLTGAEPGFKDAPGGDFALSGASPCIGKGTALPWMVGAPDLAGKPRVIGKAPDLGAFEAPPAWTVLELR